MQVQGPEGLAGAIETAKRDKADAVYLIPDALFRTHRARVAEVALRSRLPLMGWLRDIAEAGALLSYGVNVADVVRQAAGYVARILKGEKPGDLPVQQPTKIELVINAKTVKALGVTIPQQFVLRADEVIR